MSMKGIDNMSNKKLVLTIIGISILSISVITGAYAYFTASVNDNTSENAGMISGSLSLALNDMDMANLTAWAMSPSDLSRSVYLSITNNSPISVDARLLFNGLTNTYSDYLVYSVEEVTNGKANLSPRNILVNKQRVPSSASSYRTMVNKITMSANSTKYYKLTIEYIYSNTVDQTSDLGKTFYTGFSIEESYNPANETFTALNLALGNGTPNFSNISPGDGTVGVYIADDDYGSSYYFRGNVTNNYVKFGKNSNNDDMYWRIVRINGDGSLRLIYDGTQAWANGTSNADRYIGTSVFNSNYNDAKYVGYMHGGAAGVASTSYAGATANETNSTIKTYIDNWYTTNIKNTGYESYLSDEIFCNDRSISSGGGYATSKTIYSAYNRLYANRRPMLICPQKNDAFTVNDTAKGNGALTNPVGLLTADEACYAGGMYGTGNTNYYLYKGLKYWLGSVDIFNDRSGAYTHYVHNDGYVYNINVYAFGNVAPVINLSAQTAQSLVGNGTASTPYQLS